MQFKGKLINQTWENGKNLILGPILAQLAQILGSKTFLVNFTYVSHSWKLSLYAFSQKTKEPN